MNEGDLPQLATIRGYFDAWAAAEPTEEFAVGPLAAADSLILAAKPTNESRAVEIRRLAVERSDDATASAALEGTVKQIRGDVVLTEELTGPVELRQEDGTWRVVRYYRNGWPHSPALVEGVSDRAGSVLVIPRVVEFRRGGTWLAIEARNEGPDDARFTGIRLANPLIFSLRRMPKGHIHGPLPAGRTVFREGAVPPLPKARERLDLRVRLEQAGRQHEAQLIIEL